MLISVAFSVAFSAASSRNGFLSYHIITNCTLLDSMSLSCLRWIDIGFPLSLCVRLALNSSLLSFMAIVTLSLFSSSLRTSRILSNNPITPFMFFLRSYCGRFRYFLRCSSLSVTEAFSTYATLKIIYISCLRTCRVFCRNMNV